MGRIANSLSVRRLEVCDLQVELVGIDHILVALVAQRERVLENPAGGVRDARLPCDRVRDQLASAAQQVRMTRLMAGIGELPVGRPPIPFQHPREPC